MSLAIIDSGGANIGSVRYALHRHRLCRRLYHRHRQNRHRHLKVFPYKCHWRVQ